VRATWRPLPAWPYPPRPKQRDQFDSTWSQTLNLLQAEIEMVDGRDPIIGIVADNSQFNLDGQLRGNAKVNHPGAEVSFDSGGRRLVFYTDAFGVLQSNLRAIALGLKALRAVSRYGITEGLGAQYAGFAQLSDGGPDPARGKMLVEKYGSVAEALKRTHPDQGGEPRQLADVQAYRKLVGAAAR
jgi:hypothetical protein